MHWTNLQIANHQEIRDSFNFALPSLIAGTTPAPLAWSPDGYVQPWDRGPQHYIEGSAHGIVAAACRASEMSIDEFYGSRKSRRHARTRQAVVYILKENNSLLGYVEIAEMVGYKDHSTIYHALRTMKKELKNEGSAGYIIYHKTRKEMVR